MDLKTTIKLNNGVEMPILGFGTWKMQGEEAKKAVLIALKKGYRHIDTATFYQNEEQVGEAIKESGLKREDLFITTKLNNPDHLHAESALNESLMKLDTNYVDMYLIHGPVAETRIQAWKSLEKLYKEGKCIAIGVSNFMINHLKELLEVAEIVPAVNQIEFHPYLYEKELLDFCNEKGIKLEAYRTLTNAVKLKDPQLMSIAKKYNKTPAQLLIRWCLQHNVISIPKSSHEERIKENADVFDFEISKEDMNFMDSLNENLRVTSWNPRDIP